MTVPRIGLALGSGAARGLAHIGVLQVLIEEGIPIDCIAGCSMGAVVAALYATGSDMYMLEKYAKTLSEKDLLDVTVPRMGLLKGNRAEEIIRTLAKNKRFDHTDIPLVVTATDIVTGQHIILKEGDISRAVRASISIPGVFEPVEMGNMVLVDGAVTERVPVHAIQILEPDIVIAVDVGYRGISRQKPSNIFETLLLSFEVMEWGLVHEHLVHADVLVTPDVYQINPASLKETEKCIRLGREGAKEALGRIREAIQRWQDQRITKG